MTKTLECKAHSASSADQPSRSPGQSEFPRVGLALSGGGFRAALFHLGVIRRLEELDIMRRIDTISAVSGGSIIAAYYVIEMQKRLRVRGVDRRNPSQLAKERLTIYEDIAGCFCNALDQNLRSRAIVFGPFYHPLLWLKSLLPNYSRSDILQKEYDKWFYSNGTLDHLPVVAPDGGPRVVLNATSLLTGNRREFARQSISGLKELHRVNRNVLKLSRAVGASSAVPGVFPPTAISGDMLVDGGVSDNQGIDALVGSEWGASDRPQDNDQADSRDGFDILLVSDASGQMEMIHRVGKRSIKVLTRTVSVYQYQLRMKLIRLLRLWQTQRANSREFALVHLYLNLKDDPRNPPRVPSEYIPALGRIRTDLDQFSHIEREALIYHGYTLIDAQIRKHCPQLWRHCGGEQCDGKEKSLRHPPLFSGDEVRQTVEPQCDSDTRLRKRVKEILAIGSQSIFLFRSRAKYPSKSWVVFGPAIGGYVAGLEGLRRGREWLHETIVASILGGMENMIPAWMERLGIWVFGEVAVSVDSGVIPFVVGFVLWSYLLLFLTYEATRWAVCRWDRKDYRKLTGVTTSVRWRRRTRAAARVRETQGRPGVLEGAGEAE